MGIRIGENGYVYKTDLRWAKLPDTWLLKDVADVAVDSADNVYVFNRTQHPMMVFKSDGTFIRSWGEGLFSRPHGVTIDPEGFVWCVDDFGHCVRKCTAEGDCVMTIGTPNRTPGFQSGLPFCGPTKTAFDVKTGGVYVSDGYANARVHKFSGDGKHLFSWGEPGQGEGQFNLAHSVCVDKEGKVYVASREGHTLQVFTPDGDYLNRWDNVHLPNGFHIAASDDQLCYVGEGRANNDYCNQGGNISVRDLNGNVLAHLSTDELPFSGAHGIAVDSTGSIYACSVGYGSPGYWQNDPEDQLIAKLTRT